MVWFKKIASPKVQIQKKQQGAADEFSLWMKCDQCGEILLRKDIDSNYHVCPKCSHHYPLPALKRFQLLLDEGTFLAKDLSLISNDPLEFKDSKKYIDRINNAQKTETNQDAFRCGEGCISSIPVEMGVFDFAFMGGSMGSVVGEKVCRVIERGTQAQRPVIISIASGGARMQEGILSLMQMAKTSGVLSQFRKCRKPFITILTDPTTGGVAASFALLGDIIIAEPKALIGFAGPRVIEQTIKQKLPEGFQRSEFLLQHGLIDMVVPRHQLKPILSSLLPMMT